MNRLGLIVSADGKKEVDLWGATYAAGKSIPPTQKTITPIALIHSLVVT